MSANKDPKWEVVDSIPGERKGTPPSKPPFWKSKSLWIGIGVGVLAVTLFAPLRIMIGLIISKAAQVWWIIPLLFVYWVLTAKRKPRQ